MSDFLKDGFPEPKTDPIKKNMRGEITEINGMPVNSAANIVPFTGDIERLATSIKRSGLRLPITLYKGEIVDGRRRATACYYADIEPRFDNIEDNLTEKELYELVLDLNNRRDLSQSQKALVSANECQNNKHKIMGYRTAIDYAKEIWGISKSLHEAGTWLWKHYPGYAQCMFDDGVVEVNKKRFKSVVGLKNLLSKEPDRYNDGDIDIARAKDMFIATWELALKNIKYVDVLKGAELAKDKIKQEKDA